MVITLHSPAHFLSRQVKHPGQFSVGITSSGWSIFGRPQQVCGPKRAESPLLAAWRGVWRRFSRNWGSASGREERPGACLRRRSPTKWTSARRIFHRLSRVCATPRWRRCTASRRNWVCRWGSCSRGCERRLGDMNQSSSELAVTFPL
jgi:hypothetical protein